MRAVGFRSVLAGSLMALVLGGCFSRNHPDYERYEYLYIDGAFQGPYKAFPTGTDRIEWKCYDSRVDREYDCTFVRGGWEHYQYIYRPRRR